ncbi:hypothetical protein ABVT39_024385 [Epinephelus coioides]
MACFHTITPTGNSTGERLPCHADRYQTARCEYTQSATAVKKYIMTGDEFESLHLNVCRHAL